MKLRINTSTLLMDLFLLLSNLEIHQGRKCPIIDFVVVTE